jgi:hypothetical protein
MKLPRPPNEKWRGRALSALHRAALKTGRDVGDESLTKWATEQLPKAEARMTWDMKVQQSSEKTVIEINADLSDAEARELVAAIEATRDYIMRARNRAAYLKDLMPEGMEWPLADYDTRRP